MANIAPRTTTMLGDWQATNYSINGSVVDRQSGKSTMLYSRIESSGVLRKRPVGWKPPSNYYVDRIKYLYGAGTRRSYDNQGRLSQVLVGFSSTHETPYTVPQLDMLRLPASLHFQLVNKLLDQKVSLGVELAELPKTIQLVGDTAANIATGIRQFRRGNFARAAEAIGLNKPTSKWLEYRYGWTPLLMSVRDQVEVLKNGLGDARFSVSGSIDNVRDDFVQGPWLSRRRYDQLLRYDFSLRNPGALGLSRLGLLNPLEIAWELVPFSFVADWFIPIGDQLAELTLRALYDFRGGSYTCRGQIKAKRSGWTSYHSNGKVSIQTDSKASYERFRMQRTAYSSLPFGITLAIRPNISPQRALDGIALLEQAVGRRFRDNHSYYQ